MIMKKPFLFIPLLLTFASCEDSREADLADLTQERLRIIAFAQSGQCGGNAGCRFLGLGSKPCGGPWEYLVYATSIDTLQLYQMVLSYNIGQDTYNRKWNIGSDCSVPQPPDSVVCVNGACTGYWNGVPGG